MKLDYAAAGYSWDDPTQHVATADVAERPGSRGHCANRCGHFESKAAVRPMLVVGP
jgi:hypothetical protein